MVGSFISSLHLSGLTSTLIFLLVACLSVIASVIYSNIRSSRLMEKRWSSVFENDQNPDIVHYDIIANPSSENQKVLSQQNFKMVGWVLTVIGAGLLFLWYLFDFPFVFGGAPVFLGICLIQSLNTISNKKRKALSVQFPEAIDLLVRGARVGVTPEENIRQVSLELPSPLSTSFKEISHQLDIGLPFEQVLQDTANKMDLREFRFLAATLTIQRKTGARYVEVLENLSQLIRSHHEQAQRRDAATSEARLASKVVAGLVGVSCGLLFLFNRDQFDFLITDPTGQNLAIYCVLSLAVGFLIMYQMLGRFQ